MSYMNLECCICMDDICQDSNRVTTECGHTFHTSCLMKSVAHNGFGCPYCRSKMAEEVDDDDDSYYQSDFEEELFDDDALTSFRMFMQRINGEEVEEEPEEETEEETEEQEEEETEPAIPSASFIAKKLINQGITMEDLVKCLLLNHEEYDSEAYDEELNRADSVMFGKFRVIISNYTPEQDETMCDCNGLCRMCRN